MITQFAPFLLHFYISQHVSLISKPFIMVYIPLKLDSFNFKTKLPIFFYTVVYNTIQLPKFVEINEAARIRKIGNLVKVFYEYDTA